MYEFRDITTGRYLGGTWGRDWACHANDEAWWAVCGFKCSEPDRLDGHTHEVCLYNLSQTCSTPTWPILAFYNEADAQEWMRKLQKFACTIPPEKFYEHYDKAVNGDKRLAAWLTENGFVRYNHVWWKKEGE